MIQATKPGNTPRRGETADLLTLRLEVAALAERFAVREAALQQELAQLQARLATPAPPTAPGGNGVAAGPTAKPAREGKRTSRRGLLKQLGVRLGACPRLSHRSRPRLRRQPPWADLPPRQ